VILGILSDTHGRRQRTARAVELLERCGAEAFIHCGDVGGAAVLDQFAGRRAWFVWGNIDQRDAARERYAESLGITPPRTIPTEIEIDGHLIAVYHGHEPQFTGLLRAIEEEGVDAVERLARRPDYILHGHTHRAADRRVGSVRLINPGALERSRQPTVATLDVGRDALRFWVVDEHADDLERPRAFRPG
jgi:hypothetical protein